MAVTISHEADSKIDDLDGMKVSQAREAYKELFNIHDDAGAKVNGIPVDPDYELKSGDKLEFTGIHDKK